MAFGVYDAFEDPYAYRGTQVLRNKAGIHDAARLEAFELEMSTVRALEPFPVGRLSAAHYCRIHRHLFQDVYAWAGRYRTVRTGKGGNWFCYPEYIASEMRRLFAALRQRHHLKRLPPADFAVGAAWFLGELNAIHPFREGNGRTQLSFLHLLALEQIMF